MLGDVRADSGFELDFTEVLGGHLEQVVKTADMLIDRETLSHFY